METGTKVISPCTLSDTFPELPQNMIPRLQYVNLFETQLKDEKMIYVYGEEGYGVTNTLAQFVLSHSETCFSYFANDLDYFLYNEDIILSSLGKQISFYINPESYNNSDTVIPSFNELLLALMQSKKKYGHTVYFVLDGFERTPLEKMEDVKRVFSLLPWGSAKFILSGKKQDYERLIPNPNKNCSNVTNAVMIFTAEEMETYFRGLDINLSPELLSALRSVAGGVAQKMDIMARKYKDTGSFSDYLNLEQTSLSDLYDVDFNKILEQHNPDNERLLALAAFSRQKLTLNSVCIILQLSKESVVGLIENNTSFIKYENEEITFKSEGGHKYIRKVLERLKEQVELLLIDYFERNPSESLDILPALYRSCNKRGKLIQYLNSEKVQAILINKKSQAALNEQCRYGFDACENKISHFSDSYRFALCHSSSVEIEKNELWDNEIEALLSIGKYSDAIYLAQSIYLDEEKLKSFAIIARHQIRDRGYVDESIMEMIHDLHQNIDFENMPDKSLELAKLLIQVDFTISMDIADRVAKLNEGKGADRIYSMLSLSLFDDIEKNVCNFSNFDTVTSRINDSELKAFSNALRSLFDECTPSDLLEKVKTLPNISQQLFLLNNWISANKKKDNIGVVVKYAVDLVIASSNEKVPKTSYLANISEALPYVSDIEAMEIVKSLDDIIATIKYPSKDYTIIQIRIIESLSRTVPNEAIERLVNLFIYIQDLSNKSIKIECEALILKNYERLGVKTDIERQFRSSYDLLKHIQKGVDDLFQESAYHYKVVEGAIKTLVCDYRTFIFDTISKMNTRERRSKAYLFAAQEYVKQSSLDHMKWDYLEKMVSRIDYPIGNQIKPLVSLLRKCLRHKEKATPILSKIRKFSAFFEKTEDAYVKCEVYSILYCLFEGDDNKNYRSQLYGILNKTWEEIEDKRQKIDAGYLIAYIISDSSQEIAQKIVEKTISLQNQYVLPSSSCVVGLGISLELYVKSLGILIKADCYNDSYISEFDRIISQLESPVEEIILWNKICLNFYFSNKFDQFKKYVSDKVLQPLDSIKCSSYTLKRLYYYISPTLYFYNDSLLLTRLEDFDPIFYGSCIQHIIRVILYQYPDALDIDEKQEVYELEYDDYLSLCTLLEHSNMDGQIFDVVDIISNSIVENINKHISVQHRQKIKTKLAEIVERKLPMKDGIQHDGYKIACRIAIENIDNKRRKKGDWNEFVEEIEKVPNIADKSFLYTYLAGFVEYKADKEQFLLRGFNLASTITSRYDKTQRMKMCLDRCKKNKSLYDRLVKEAFKDTVNDKNGSYSDLCDIIDSAQQYDDALANDLIEQLDQDPARLHYKDNLRKKLVKNEKLKKAKNDRKSIGDFTEDEYSDFFKGQVADLIAGKSTIWTEEQLNKIMPSLYKYSVSTSFYSIVFILENLFYRQKRNPNMKCSDILLKLYQANLWNLKIVLSLASGTKEKLERLKNTVLKSSEDTSAVSKYGDKEKTIAEIKRWYIAHPFNNLKIIDADFFPEDLSLIKSLFDINDRLQVKILTNRKNVSDIQEYQNAWDRISSDLTGSIFVNTICWSDNPDEGPLNGKWWILKNQSMLHGVRIASVSESGENVTEISPMSIQEIHDKENVWEDFIWEMPSIDGKNLNYEKIRIKK